MFWLPSVRDGGPGAEALGHSISGKQNKAREQSYLN